MLDWSRIMCYTRYMKNKKANPEEVTVVVNMGTGQMAFKPVEGKNPAAVALGRLGGLKGGRARADSLTAEQRVEIAKKAAKIRWKQK